MEEIMNKELRELLDSINEKKEAARKLVADNKLDEAKALKNEISQLQDKFDVLKDLYEDEKYTFEDNLSNGKTKKLNGDEPENRKKDSTKDFANAARKLFMVNNQMSEGMPSAGGYTVPEDIETKINHYRQAKGALQNLVRVTPVKTNKGGRTFRKRAQQTGFTKVGEGAKISKKNTPQYERLVYEIDKYAGFFPITNELLSDSDQNIVEDLTKWIGDESRVTRNKLIYDALKTKTNRIQITNEGTIKNIINVKLDPTFKSSAIVLTNQDGFDWLDQLKDANGRGLLEESLSSSTGYKVKSLEIHVYSNQDLPSEGGKAPFIVGDLKEAVEFFDRQRTTIKGSDVAMDAFEEDLTLFRAIEREDVKVRDEGAFVFGEITIEATVEATE